MPTRDEKDEDVKKKLFINFMRDSYKIEVTGYDDADLEVKLREAFRISFIEDFFDEKDRDALVAELQKELLARSGGCGWEPITWARLRYFIGDPTNANLQEFFRKFGYAHSHPEHLPLRLAMKSATSWYRRNYLHFDDTFGKLVDQ